VLAAFAACTEPCDIPLEAVVTLSDTTKVKGLISRLYVLMYSAN
jgi:hypothetical protein